MSWYTTWFGTPYYQLLYGHRDEQEAREWVDALLAKSPLPRGSEVLDIACGRGRHARCFAEAGMRVTGIDLSREIVDEARRCVPDADFQVHDMREPFARDRFDLAVCLFTSLGYSPDRGDDQRSIEAAAQALKPGGRYVLDLLNPVRTVRDLVKEERVRVNDVEFSIHRCIEGDAIVKRIDVQDKGCALHFSERVHAFAPEEIGALVERSGLRIVDRTDGPDFMPFDVERSQRLVIWAERPRWT